MTKSTTGVYYEDYYEAIIEIDEEHGDDIDNYTEEEAVRAIGYPSYHGYTKVEIEWLNRNYYRVRVYYED